LTGVSAQSVVAPFEENFRAAGVLVSASAGVPRILVVLFYFILLALSMTGVIASNWNKEVAVSYAPPTFLGADTESDQMKDSSQKTEALPENPVDPLKDVIQQLNAEIQAEQQGSSVIDNYGVVDPLAEDMQQIDQQLGGHLLDQKQELKTTLPFGADKWGQDVLLKTIKGAETSILVGLLSALLAVVIGTFLGAIAGYFGGWIDDVLNWFYNIFTSIPYLLLVLAIAAVLQQKGILSIVLIFRGRGQAPTGRSRRHCLWRMESKASPL
jgi:peptide/nickel transport system permease protein